MADSFSKVFAWQLVIAAVVGLLWFVLWELASATETGFFFDFPWGLFQGFVGGVVVLVILGVVAGGIWAGVTMSRSEDGGMGGAMRANLDRIADSSMITGLNDTLDSWNASGVIMGIGWALKVAIGWALAAGIVWGLDTNFIVSLIVVLVFGLGGALLMTWAFEVTVRLVENVGQGFDWLERPLSAVENAMENAGMRQFPVFAVALAWGVAGLFAAGGLGAGVVQAIVLGLVALLAAAGGGILGAQMKARA